MKRLNDAKLRLHFAQDYLKEVVDEIQSNEIAAVDGHLEYHRAIKAEIYALRECARVLRVVNKLVFEGTLSDESMDSKTRF